jgi:hypothetical protein
MCLQDLETQSDQATSNGVGDESANISQLELEWKRSLDVANHIVPRSLQKLDNRWGGLIFLEILTVD